MIHQKIIQDSVTALKNKDSVKREILSFIIAQLKNVAIREKVELLSDTQVINTLRKHSKTVQDTLSYLTEDYPDKKERCLQELNLIDTYIKDSIMSEDMLRSLVLSVIEELNATSMKDMKAIISKISETNSFVDSSEVAKIVRERFN